MPEKCMLMYAFVVTGTLQALVNKKKTSTLYIFFFKVCFCIVHVYDSSTVIQQKFEIHPQERWAPV